MGSANIGNVDYEQIAKDSCNIREQGVQMNNELASAWNEVDGLRTTWHGKRYNELISLFNSIALDANNLISMVLRRIPKALWTAASNYAKADNASVPAYEEAMMAQLKGLENTDTATMAFNSDDAENARKVVTDSFDRAIDYMGEIQEIFNKTPWESDSKESFEATLTNLKNNIVNALEGIKSNFTTNINNAKADMEAAESANNVSAE